MIKIERGNPDSLEGRALIYVRNISSREKEYPIYGSFIATNPIDILIMSGMESMSNYEIKQSKEKFGRIAKETFGGSFSEIKPLFATSPINFTNNEDFKKIDGDVINGGLILEAAAVKSLIASLVIVYHSNYYSQLEEKITKHTNKNVSTIYDSFHNYNEQTLKNRLYQMISGLIYSIETKDVSKEHEISADLRKFSDGSQFIQEITNLIGTVQMKHPKRDQLIECYVEMICGIHGENFEKCANSRDKIKELLK